MADDLEDLAEALKQYIDPNHPDFDLEFTVEIMTTRPEWFSQEERDTIKQFLKTQKKDL